MKRLAALVLFCLLLAGCGAPSSPADTSACMEQLTLYLPDDNAEFLETKVVSVSAVNEQNILEQLKLEAVLKEEVAVNSFTQNDLALTLDVNGAFSQQVCSMGTAGEYMIIGSVVNTFLTAYHADCIIITVDGKPWESGHAVYDAPLFFFE